MQAIGGLHGVNTDSFSLVTALSNGVGYLQQPGNVRFHDLSDTGEQGFRIEREGGRDVIVISEGSDLEVREALVTATVFLALRETYRIVDPNFFTERRLMSDATWVAERLTPIGSSQRDCAPDAGIPCDTSCGFIENTATRFQECITMAVSQAREFDPCRAAGGMATYCEEGVQGGLEQLGSCNPSMTEPNKINVCSMVNCPEGDAGNATIIGIGGLASAEASTNLNACCSGAGGGGGGGSGGGYPPHCRAISGGELPCECGGPCGDEGEGGGIPPIPGGGGGPFYSP